MGRTIVFSAMASEQRVAFLRAHKDVALAVLTEVEKISRTLPEEGTPSALRKNRFSLTLFVTIHNLTFKTAILYAFTKRMVRWETFAWKVVKAVPTLRLVK